MAAKKLNHQGEFLVTGLQGQVLIECLRITKHALTLLIQKNEVSTSTGSMGWFCWVNACLFTKEKEKSSMTKLAPVCFKKYLSECNELEP